MTQAITELDIIEELDFDIEIACEADEPECPRAAEWSIRRKCCGMILLFCTEHKDVLMKRAATFASMMCVKCGAGGLTDMDLVVTKL